MKRMKQYGALPAITLLLAGAWLAGCNKDKEDEPVPEPVPKSAHIAFGTSSIGLAKADSVLVTLVNADKTKTITGKGAKKTTDYLVALDTLPAGNWQMDVTVYSKPGNGGFKYTLSKTLTLPLAEKLTIEGPTSLLADQWKSLLYIKEAGFSITVPLDPTDPAFEVRSFQGPWGYVNVERHLFKGTTSLDAEVFQCGAECFPASNIISNNTTFADFSNRAKTKDWNKGEIYIFLINTATNDDKTIYWQYDRK
ncbi:hypothetical protein [Paraflavitalea sp. CAU 1676]|uniref:hypothetical protein n=1 Tax=Paraflavitalea sp. CAU 1676 TaxID=3032598 RepID=UPI0023DBADCC|nr:hypothetical protein [Paraflavitalea sp. CAU 1676]MDF2191538.1 hypothetical protein [Paraflavitalea sp. CAU 1676]